MKKDIKTFRQVPIYDTSTEFTLTALEFYEFVKMAEAASNYLPFFEKFIAKQLDLGLMKIRYESMDGKELSKKQIEKILKDALTEIHTNNLPSIEPEI